MPLPRHIVIASTRSIPAPPPQLPKIQGVPMLVPHHLNPPISGIDYHWQLQKTPPFPRAF